MKTESRNWLVLAVLLLCGWLVYRLAAVLTPFAVATALAYFGDPLVDRLQRVSVWRWKIGRSLAVSVVFVLLLSLLVLVLLILVPALLEQVHLLIKRLPAWLDWFSATALPWLAAKTGLDLAGVQLPVLAGMVKDYWQEISTAAVSVVNVVSRGGMAVATWLTNLVLIPVVTFYLLRDWDDLMQGIEDMLPRKIRGDVEFLAREVDAVLSAFFRGQLMVMVALGAIYAAGLSLLGLDFAVLIGLTAGLLSIVPYLGSIAGVVVASATAVYQFHDGLHVLLVLLVFGVGQTAEGMFLTPRLVGDRIGLHPVAVIFAVLAGGQLFGFLGILLALPVTAALNVLVMYLHGKYRQSELYNSDTGAGD